MSSKQLDTIQLLNDRKAEKKNGPLPTGQTMETMSDPTVGLSHTCRKKQLMTAITLSTSCLEK